ncbi:MAG TPA: hypothetical protein VF049_11855, partial [Nocardioidaceae bacterium]
MAERVVVHIGAPKSGTTFLQTVLWQNRGRLREAGVLVPGRQLVDFNRCAKAWRTRVRGSGPAAEAWARVRGEVAGWSGTAVLSNEWFCLTPADLVARVVEELAPGRVQVAFTARAFLGQVPAAWQETLKLGSGIGLDRFIEELDHDGQRWSWWTLDPARVLARWAGPVPVEDVHVVTVPPRGQGADVLWARFAQVCGVDPAGVDTTRAQANESLAVESAALLQRLGPHLHREVDFTTLPWQEPYRWLRRYLGHRLLVPLPGDRIALSPEQADRIRARSVESVARLRKAGYRVHGDLQELLGPATGTPATGTHPDQVPSEAMLQRALPVIAQLLAEVRTQTLRAEALEALEPEGTGEVAVQGEPRSTRQPQPSGTAYRRRVVAAGSLARRHVVAGGEALRRQGRRLLDRRSASARPSTERIYFLVANACGSGGVARTVMNLADELARDRHVEIISVTRTRNQPHYRPRNDVSITWIVDNRPGDGGTRRRPSQNPQAPAALRKLDSERSRFDVSDTVLSALTDQRLAEVLAGLEPGVLVSTRPSLHAVALELAPPHVLTVGQEHLNFVTRSQNRGVFGTIERCVPHLDAFVLLTEADREDWARTLAGTGARVETIPNSLSWEIGPPAPLEEKVVVAAGRFEARKGFARLVEAYAPLAAERPDWQLHLYGLGE